MTNEERDAAMGRKAREMAEAKRNLACLKSQARDWGNTLEELANVLKKVSDLELDELAKVQFLLRDMPAQPDLDRLAAEVRRTSQVVLDAQTLFGELGLKVS